MSPAAFVAINVGAGTILAVRGHTFVSAAAIAVAAEGIGLVLGRMYPQRFPLLAGETGREYFTNTGIVIASWWLSKQIIAPYQTPRALPR